MNQIGLAGISFLLHILAMIPLARATILDWPGLLVAGTAYFVLFGFLLHAVEAYFYFRERIVTRRHLVQGVFVFTLVAFVSSLWAFSGANHNVSLLSAIEDWGSTRSGTQLLPIVYSSLSFMVTYCIVGSATWPFVRKYYDSPNADLALCVPSGKLVIALQLGRGLIATLALVPLVSGLGESAVSVRTWGYLALTLSATFAVAPMLAAPREWPIRLRVIHGVEIVVFVTIQSFFWWIFLTG